MRHILQSLFVLAAFVSTAMIGRSGEQKDDKLSFDIYAKGYFVKNKAPLPGNPAHLLLQDKKSFDDIFSVGFTMGAKPKLINDKLFETHWIVAVVKSGNAMTTFEVEQVRRDKGRVIVQYKATDKGPSSARFNSALIASVPRGDYTEVVFMENGKEASKVAVKK